MQSEETRGEREKAWRLWNCRPWKERRKGSNALIDIRELRSRRKQSSTWALIVIAISPGGGIVSIRGRLRPFHLSFCGTLSSCVKIDFLFAPRSGTNDINT